MADLALILASVAIVSLCSLVGIFFIGLKDAFLKHILMALLGFASGSLIGDAFIHLLPEALEKGGPSTFYYAMVGMVSFFVLEKFLYWRHCHEEDCPVHTFASLNLIGDGIHNFIDGMIIAASFDLSNDLGVATTFAVIFHEIPQEIGDFGILVYSGLGRRKALTYNFVSALTAVAGAITTYYLTSIHVGIEMFLVPFAAGSFIYIAATDLMPELHKRHQLGESVIQLASILTGIGLMFVLKILSS